MMKKVVVCKGALSIEDGMPLASYLQGHNTENLTGNQSDPTCHIPSTLKKNIMPFFDTHNIPRRNASIEGGVSFMKVTSRLKIAKEKSFTRKEA